MPFNRNIMTWEEYLETDEYKIKQREKAKQSYLRKKCDKWHCGHCNVDIESTYFNQHIKTKKHLKNFNEAKYSECYLFPKETK